MMSIAAKCLFFFGILLLISARISCERHTVYWDVRLEPRLRDELYIEVDVNDWMDILCPHKASFNRSELDINSFYLEVYNVTSRHYQHCAVTGQQRLLHCKEPRQEVKLTTKFQTSSPSPIGFVFQPGQTYYYISKPIHKKETGCGSDTLKMAIKVRESYPDKAKNKQITKQQNKSISSQDLSTVSRNHHHEKKVATEKDKKMAMKNALKKFNIARTAAPSSEKNKPKNSAQSALRNTFLKSWSSITVSICLIMWNFILM